MVRIKLIDNLIDKAGPIGRARGSCVLLLVWYFWLGVCGLRVQESSCFSFCCVYRTLIGFVRVRSFIGILIDPSISGEF